MLSQTFDKRLAVWRFEHNGESQMRQQQKKSHATKLLICHFQGQISHTPKLLRPLEYLFSKTFQV